MTPLCRHLSPTTQEIVNWVTTADGCVPCVHSAYTTQLDFAIGKIKLFRLVETVINYLRIPSSTICEFRTRVYIYKNNNN